MINQISFRVPGQPVTWKRTATFRGRRITPKKQREYQAKVRACAMAAAGRVSWDLSARYSVSICATRSDRRPYDLDNLAKTVLDALNGCAWVDDSQVDVLRVYRQPPIRFCPLVEVFITRLDLPPSVASGSIPECQPKKTPSVTPSRSRRSKRPG